MSRSSSFQLEIPDNVLDQVRIPESELGPTLKRELGRAPGRPRCCPGPRRAGSRGSGGSRSMICSASEGSASELTEEDFEAELVHLEALRGADVAPEPEALLALAVGSSRGSPRPIAPR